MHIHIENATAPLRVDIADVEAAIRSAGIEAPVRITENSDAEAFPASAAGADIILSCRKIDIAAAKDIAPDLGWVQLISAGVEAVLPHLPDDVALTNASGVHGPKGSDFILAACLMLNFRIPAFVDDKATHLWAPTFGGPIAGKRVTLLGVGGIGAAAAAKLKAQGLHVTGVTRSGTSSADLDRCIAVTDLDKVLPETDILVSSLPLTAETEGLVSRARLQALPQGAGVVSVGRAKVFDHAALLDLLNSGHLGGAVLDVLPEEPAPADDPVWDCPRLILTPHCSMDDHESYMRSCLEIFTDNLARRQSGQPLRNLVDRARGY